MESLQYHVDEYKKQLEKGSIQKAYKGLMEYMTALKTHFANQHPDWSVPGSLYFGYMDMTYFSLNPAALKGRRLKIAVVFLHEACRFEIWLSGYNKQVQSQYWNMIKESGWKKYRLVPDLKGMDSIIEHTAAESPNFDDLEALTGKIERETLQFLQDVETFLVEH